MKITCTCGNEFDITQLEYREPYKRPCPVCKRSFQVWIALVPEKQEFWK